MLDLRETVVPKSDQLNADDLVSGPRTILVTKVARTGDESQTTAIDYEGSNGRPYKPCKTMRRLLVELWGYDGEKYIGRSMTLVRDPQVKWGGVEVGGIRISHLSDIPADTMTTVTVTRGKKAPFKVQKLASGAKTQNAKAPPSAADVILAIDGAQDRAKLVAVMKKAAAYDWSIEEREKIEAAHDAQLNALTRPQERQPGED